MPFNRFSLLAVKSHSLRKDATYVVYESRDLSLSTGPQVCASWYLGCSKSQPKAFQIKIVGTNGQTPSYVSGRLSSGFGANEDPFVFIDVLAYHQRGHLQGTIVYATTVLSEQ